MRKPKRTFNFTTLLNLLIKKGNSENLMSIIHFLRKLPINQLEELHHNLKLMVQTSIITEALGCVEGEIDIRKEKQKQEVKKTK
jgi:hypothetical protein